MFISKQIIDDFKKSAEIKEYERLRMQLFAMMRAKDIEHYEAILDGKLIPDIVHALVSQYPKTDQEKQEFRAKLESIFTSLVDEHIEIHCSSKLKLGSLASSRQMRDLEQRNIDRFNAHALEMSSHLSNLALGLKEKRKPIKPQDLKI